MSEINHKKRILIVGIDGGTWTILKPAIEQGYMPFLKNLAENGSAGELESTMPAITPAAWSTFQTGMNPGAFGVFNFSYWDSRTRKISFVSSNSLQNTIWERLSSAGKRVAVINVPMTYPPRQVNGCMVTGILTPSTESSFTYPEDLKKTILDSFPDYHIFNLDNVGLSVPTDEQFSAYVANLSGILKQRCRVGKLIMDSDNFDVFMIHFQATDIIQHRLWNFMDPSDSLYNEQKKNIIFENIYGVLDASISEIHNAFSEKNSEFLTVILSDHGFQSHKKRINLGNWLRQNGFLTVNKKSFKTPLIKRFTRKFRIGRLLRPFLKNKVMQDIEKTINPELDPVNWNRTKAFAIGKSNEGFIYVLGRDDREKNILADEITEKLSKLCDPETNQPVVKNIYRKADIYSGPYMDRMADLIIEPADACTFTGQYQKGKEIFQAVDHKTDYNIGRHHKNGVLVANGSGIIRNSKLHTHLINMAPTILYYMGLLKNNDMDGNVISELFTKSFLKSCPLPDESAKNSVDKKHDDNPYDKNENELIEKRLRDLGYM